MLVGRWKVDGELAILTKRILHLGFDTWQVTKLNSGTRRIQPYNKKVQCTIALNSYQNWLKKIIYGWFDLFFSSYGRFFLRGSALVIHSNTKREVQFGFKKNSKFHIANWTSLLYFRPATESFSTCWIVIICKKLGTSYEYHRGFSKLGFRVNENC